MSEKALSIKRVLWALLVVAGVLCVPLQPAFGVPLNYVSVTNGASVSPSLGSITLCFGNNVAAGQVFAANASHISLVDETGAVVAGAGNVYRQYYSEGAPDAENPDVEGQRRYLYLSVPELQPGTTYTLIVTPGVRSIGNHDYDGLTVTFTTTGEKLQPIEPEESAEPEESDPGSGGNDNGQGSGSGSTTGPGDGNGSSEVPGDSNDEGGSYDAPKDSGANGSSPPEELIAQNREAETPTSPESTIAELKPDASVTQTADETLAVTAGSPQSLDEAAAIASMSDEPEGQTAGGGRTFLVQGSTSLASPKAPVPAPSQQFDVFSVEFLLLLAAMMLGGIGARCIRWERAMTVVTP